jgi:rhodanese-related sulfurtransferase
MIRQFIILTILAIIVGLASNAINSNGVPLIGDYRELSAGDGPIIPPEADEGDPPFIGLQLAQMEHAAGKSIFVDARDESEFQCGTIPGSISIPFDYLPEENLEGYLDSALGHISKDDPIITFCSGEECDLSLHLGRNLQSFGYTNVAIFFGGAREWEKAGLEMERRIACGE